MPVFHKYLLPLLSRKTTMLISGVPFINRRKLSVPSSPPSEEPLKDYVRGGYHPIKLGDVFQDRYKVVRKLGWGGYSTVWLAKDIVSNRHVAVKVLTAEVSASDKLHELEFLQCTQEHNPHHPGYSHVMHHLDHFHHSGPHGSHLCLVSEVLGESVQWLSTYYRRNVLPRPIVKQIAKQVLLGLDYLHSCGIIHTDLKADNFLLEIDNVEAVIEQEQSQYPPTTYPPISFGGNEITYVNSQPLPIGDIDYLINLSEVKVKISDLGVACWKDKVSEHISDLIQSPGLRAPEVEIGAGWDENCDTWSMGCNIYQMLTGLALFPSDIARGSHVVMIIMLFGEFPRDMINRGKYSGEFFKENGKFIYDFTEKVSLSDKLSPFSKVMDATEFEQMLSFLGLMFRLQPSERPSPGELAEHPWLML